WKCLHDLAFDLDLLFLDRHETPHRRDTRHAVEQHEKPQRSPAAPRRLIVAERVPQPGSAARSRRSQRCARSAPTASRPRPSAAIPTPMSRCASGDTSPTANVYDESATQPSSVTPRSIEIRPPSRARYVVGIPWTTIEFGEMQSAAGNPLYPFDVGTPPFDRM